jgi:hypothetical protein
VAGGTLVAVPQAQADGGLGSHLVIAAEAGTGELVVGNPVSDTVDSTSDNLAAGFTISHTGLGMYPGTRPAIATDGHTAVVAFEANNGVLWVNGVNTGLGMRVGTSPAIVSTANGWEVAFQANTGTLWLTGAYGTGNTGLGMNPASSPAITSRPGASYEVAFEASVSNSLWL